MNENVSVDSRKLLQRFANLNFKKQANIYKKSLTEAGRILQRSARKNLRAKYGRVVSHKNWWNGKSLQSGIQVKAQRNIQEEGVKVHIMGDFRLRFFEKGTKQRYTTGDNKSNVRGKTPKYRQHNPHSTGSIKGTNWFKQSITEKEREVISSIDNFILKNIDRIVKK